MIYSGISHYADQRDAFFLDDGKLRVRIATARGDMGAVYLHTRDKYIDPAQQDTRACYKMKRYASDFGHDYFSADIEIPMAGHFQKNPDMLCLRYFFELVDEAGARIWLGDSRFFPGEPTDVEAMYDCPLISRREMTFHIPDWAKNAVVYQIFPTRYATTEKVDDSLWYKAPIAWDDDLHGNLRGITEHLDHIKKLGVDVIYMTPIFKANTVHKYDTVDYYAVDPSLGDENDLHELIDKAHSMGMRDKSMQDLDMYHWYQRLTFFRHTINALTAGDYTSVSADDEKCLLEYHLSSGEVLIFHTADGDVTAKEYKGWKELLTDKEFDGTIPGYGCVLVRIDHK